jgi:anti-anti-sigma factor
VIGQLVNNRTNEAYGIEATPTPVGRHQSNTVRLRGFAVSRFHAEIGELAPGRPYIEDMGSTYGTYVNGKKVDGRVELKNEDQVVLGVSGGFPDGEYSFTFRLAGEPDRPAAPAQPAAPPRKIRAGEAAFAESAQAYVVRLGGVFRRHECDDFAQKLALLVKRSPKDVVVELSDVEYMNSYALGILVKLSQDVAERGRRIVLSGAQGLILKLFQTVGLDQKLGSYGTEQEALKALASGG